MIQSTLTLVQVSTNDTNEMNLNLTSLFLFILATKVLKKIIE